MDEMLVSLLCAARNFLIEGTIFLLLLTMPETAVKHTLPLSRISVLEIVSDVRLPLVIRILMN